MDENSNKIRTGFYLKKELLNECDCFLLHILCIDEVRRSIGMSADIDNQAVTHKTYFLLSSHSDFFKIQLLPRGNYALSVNLG